jgi:hypothetical protein
MKSQKKKTPAKKLRPNMKKDLFEDDVITLDLTSGSDSMISYDSASTFTITGSGASDTITLPSMNQSFNYGTIGGAGITTINNINSNSQWATGTSGYTFNNTPNTVHINNTGIDMAAGTDIKIDGKSLKEFMKKMEQRLSILVPDPAKLERFEALKKAYEHYKTMESLCFDEPVEEPKQ